MLRHKLEAILQKSEIKGGGGGGGLNQAFPRIQETLEKWTQRGSGWVVDQVEVLWLDIARYQPLRGGSYIPLPAVVRLKKTVVNVKNKDDHCLRWALRSALFPARDNVHRPSKYPTSNGLSFEGLDVPTPRSQIQRVERQNNYLAINVFGWEKGVIVHHISEQPQEIPRINLLIEMLVNTTTLGSATLIAFSITKTSTRGARTSSSAVSTAIVEKTYAQTISQSVVGSARQLYGWRCRKKVKTN